MRLLMCACPCVEALFSDPANRPDLLHCCSPGALIFRACDLSEKYRVPLAGAYTRPLLSST